MAVAILIGWASGKLSVIGEPTEKIREAKEAYRAIAKDGGKVGDVQLDKLELITGAGRLIRRTFGGPTPEPEPEPEPTPDLDTETEAEPDPFEETAPKPTPAPEPKKTAKRGRPKK